MVWKATHPENCIQYNAYSRHPYEDISCLLTHDFDALQYFQPLSKTYMDWEFITQIPPPSYKAIVSTIVASAFIMTVGNFWMLYARKSAFQIRPMVTVWNVFWMIVTGIGVLRLLPQVVHNWYHYTIQENVCSPAESLWRSGTTGLWSTIWIYAKILEVIVESILVVLLKQPCGLLQWFNNYAYVLVHGWHLNTSPVPGGSAVICIYYGIVWVMNCYCFYLNWNQLPQPTNPTALLDSIHLVQTLSGVFLSVTTLHYWKQSIWMNHRGAAQCAANEPHIRMLAFGWSGGHVVIAILSYLNKQFVKSQQQRHLQHLNQQHKKQKREQQKQKQLKKKRSADKDNKDNPDGGDDDKLKTVTFATDKNKKGTKKRTTTGLSKDQLPKGGEDSTKGNNRSSSPPDMVDESTSSNRSNNNNDNNNNDNKKTALSRKSKKKKIIEKRNKNIPNSISFDKTRQEEGEEENNNNDNNDERTSTEQPAIIAEPIQADEKHDASGDRGGGGEKESSASSMNNNSNNSSGSGKRKKKKKSKQKTKKE